MMLLDLHYKTHWEQHDRQSCSLASTTHQTLDEGNMGDANGHSDQSIENYFPAIMLAIASIKPMMEITTAMSRTILYLRII